MVALKTNKNYGQQILTGLAILFTIITAASLVIFITGKILNNDEWIKLGFWDLRIIGFAGGTIFFPILFLKYEKLSRNKKLVAWVTLVMGIMLTLAYLDICLN